jgi:hypothetical protein
MKDTEPSDWLKKTHPLAYEAAQKALEAQRKQPPMTREQFLAQLQRFGRLNQDPKRTFGS